MIELMSEEETASEVASKIIYRNRNIGLTRHEHKIMSYNRDIRRLYIVCIIANSDYSLASTFQRALGLDSIHCAYKLGRKEALSQARLFYSGYIIRMGSEGVKVGICRVGDALSCYKTIKAVFDAAR